MVLAVIIMQREVSRFSSDWGSGERRFTGTVELQRISHTTELAEVLKVQVALLRQGSQVFGVQ